MRLAILALAALVLAGCGGTKVLRESRPLEAAPALLTASDERLAATLETLVTTNGPGSWARGANWDEYRFRVRSKTGEPLTLERISVIDAVGTRIEASADRSDLIDATREVEKRYATSGELVRDASGGWYVVGGVAAMGVGATLGIASAYGTLLGGTGSAVAGAAAAGGLLVGGGIVLIGAGVVRIVNNMEVSSELRKRSTPLPAAVSSAEVPVTLFFPIAPLPSAVEIVYSASDGPRVLRVSAREALARAHAPLRTELVHREEPRFPAVATRAGLESGFVKALLVLDEDGEVRSVQILEASSRMFVPEAQFTFRGYRYNPGPGGRTVEEVMQFRR